MVRIAIISVLVWLTILAATLAAQDQVVLRNGSVFSGRIVKREANWITIVTASGTFRFRPSEIARVEGTAGPAHGNGETPVKSSPIGPVVKVVSDTFGRLEALRLDRHPAYDALGRSRVGAWALYATPGAKPHHSEERWIVEAVIGTRVTVLKELLDYGAVVGWKRETVDRRNFGPEMPASILKSCTLGKKEVRISLGRFATIRVRTEVGDGEVWTRFYCPAVSLLGLVEEYRGGTRVRRLLRFGWKGRRPQVRARRSGVGTGLPHPVAPDANPVEAAFRRARPGDFAVWRDPSSGRRWREVVFRMTPSAVTLQTQRWVGDGFRSQGGRRYDLGRADRDYLDRTDATLVGPETLRVAGRRLVCRRWRSPSGQVEFWTSPEVTAGGLVRQTIRGKVVCELVAVGRDLALIEAK